MTLANNEWPPLRGSIVFSRVTLMRLLLAHPVGDHLRQRILQLRDSWLVFPRGLSRRTLRTIVLLH
jgi:hypothetical protein